MKKTKLRAPAFETTESGKWFEVPWRDSLLACCDCGLTHSVDFRVKKGQLKMRAFRLNRVTQVVRKRRDAGAKKAGK